MKKFLLPLLILSAIPSGFAAEKSGPKCISLDAPIRFVAKDVAVDDISIEADEFVTSSRVDDISNGSVPAGKSDYSNRWNPETTDAAVDLQKISSGELNGTIALSEVKRQALKKEIGTNSCVTGITFSLGRTDGKLYGGLVKLFLNGKSDSIELTI